MAIRSLSQKHEKHHKRPDKEIVFAAVFFIAENLWSMGKWQKKKPMTTTTCAKFV